MAIKTIYYIKTASGMFLSCRRVGRHFEQIREMGPELLPDVLARRNGVSISRVLGGVIVQRWNCTWGEAVEYRLNN